MNSQLPVDTQLDTFEEKVSRLVEHLNAARQRVLDLEKEKTVLEQEKTVQADTIAKLQNQMKQLEKKVTNSPQGFSKPTNFAKIVRNNRNEAETTAELKQQLTAYIDELDRCIAYLSNLS